MMATSREISKEEERHIFNSFDRSQAAKHTTGWQDFGEGYHAAGVFFQKEIVRIAAENARLREALRPLASLWYGAMAGRADDVSVYGYGDEAITVGDVKRAREALK